MASRPGAIGNKRFPVCMPRLCRRARRATSWLGALRNLAPPQHTQGHESRVGLRASTSASGAAGPRTRSATSTSRSGSGGTPASPPPPPPSESPPPPPLQPPLPRRAVATRRARAQRPVEVGQGACGGGDTGCRITLQTIWHVLLSRKTRNLKCIKRARTSLPAPRDRK